MQIFGGFFREKYNSFKSLWVCKPARTEPFRHFGQFRHESDWSDKSDLSDFS